MHHHPSDEILLKHASGALSDSLGLIVACHIEECDTCRVNYRNYETLVSELIEDEEAAPISESLLSNVLGKLDQPREPAQRAAPVDGIPRPLWRFLPNGLKQVGWKGFFDSVKTADIETGDQRYVTRLYKIKAGSKLPTHSHRGKEFTLVLDGAFSDEHGTYREGDFILADETTEHKPVATPDKDCICLAVMDAPIKFTGWKGLLFNPLMS